MAGEQSDEQRQEQSVATLKLTVLRAEGVKDVRILGRMKCYVVAWVDPRYKRCTNTILCNNPNPAWNHQLSFSLSHRTLQDPDFRVTIQVLSPSFLIHNEKVIGSTVMSLSRIRLDKEETFTLQLWRPSGRAQGLLRATARLECHVYVGGGYYPLVDCVTDIPFESNSPPLALDQAVAEESRIPVQNYALPLVLDRTSPMESGFIPTVPSAPPMPERVDARRSFFIGMLSGAIAVVLIRSTVGR
ncbi:hypothetical protein NE237_007291 [Protea cynaroides]|uniref:C2 domain-containing protein n=1 Tax=Protea cynaroides TaxID=273540 RepID=A0A9Q0KP47_9MAGN|nr:hypothetical protein NE237_007291 [Protea cynaroides]